MSKNALSITVSKCEPYDVIYREDVSIMSKTSHMRQKNEILII